MTEHKNIYEALAAAQSEFGKVTKGATNPAFKSKYADLSDVAGVVIPVMNSHGCAVLHYVVDNAMRTEFVHAATETKVACDVPLIVDKNNMQGMKSATTYAKRIGLESLSGIAPEDDDGNAASKAPPREQKVSAPELISESQRIELVAYLDASPVPNSAFLDRAGIKDLRDLPAAKLKGAWAWLKEQEAEIKAASDKQSTAEMLDDEIRY